MINIRSVGMWLVIGWFAILQAFSPLLHAHIETDHSQSPQGIHMHGFSTDAHQDHFQHQTISHSEAHVITVDQGTLKEVFKFVPPMLAVLFALVFSFTLTRTYARLHNVQRTVPQPYRHNTHPRAPPHA